MKQSRRKFTAKFKAMVAVEALKERESLSELATRFEIHPTQVSAWKREFLERAGKAFGEEPSKEEESVDVDNLFKQIGQLQVENDFLKKSCRIRIDQL
ncbi:transposase [Dyadobacter beijingensis]|nr:transposase [Dyadobacter beijingensis]